MQELWVQQMLKNMVIVDDYLKSFQDQNIVFREKVTSMLDALEVTYIVNDSTGNILIDSEIICNPVTLEMIFIGKDKVYKFGSLMRMRSWIHTNCKKVKALYV